MLLLSIASYLLDDLGQALFIRSCHKDVIFTRKSHNCAGTAFVQGNSAGGSKLIEQTLKELVGLSAFVVKEGTNGRDFQTGVMNNASV